MTTRTTNLSSSEFDSHIGWNQAFLKDRDRDCRLGLIKVCPSLHLLLPFFFHRFRRWHSGADPLEQILTPFLEILLLDDDSAYHTIHQCLLPSPCLLIIFVVVLSINVLFISVTTTKNEFAILEFANPDGVFKFAFGSPSRDEGGERDCSGFSWSQERGSEVGCVRGRG